MNATEKNYAVRRVEDIARQYSAEISRKGVVKSLLNKKLIALILSGEAKIDKKRLRKREDNPYAMASVWDVFDFSPFYKKAEWTEKKVKKAKNKLEKKLQEVKDEIMLGDSEAAMKLLKEFADYCGKED